ncbi:MULTISPECIES: aldolase [Rhodococcus]|uniref:Ribulose-5-phosphate 4-epimerase n=1 Tax=Rhodococcus aetherivorans TaxID=191292 RepID=A0ABQ0YU95_9NOCA|nr:MULTISPECIES: aldolase [Rhodococcus]ETT23386.1 class II aldolase/adducin family protein [Rhodococcus rhodochrous ATCC 21198]NCL73808.1 L-fuculose phosphate aldolase [Rhodococcus sp. YH1]OOL29869.1 aldolase [Rhodococcus rhodochrous]ANZ24052.1 aldolase [Rhodococcus sp. WB1]KDE12100.1 aldolase [Rhodococcus aetherivorans]
MSGTFTATKAELMHQAQARMRTHLAESGWTTRQKLALTCRILFDAGHDSGLAGQITARAEEPGTYYTQQLGLGFDEITEDNLLLVDEDLQVLDGSGMANPANRFHSWIYRARPDVQCIVHTHPFHVAALSMLEVPLVVSQMDIAPLYDDCAFLPAWPGVPVGNEEGEIITAALGSKKAILLAHHGHVVAGAGIEEACSLAVLIERGAELQLAAMAAGTIAELPDRLAREAHDWTLTPKRSQANFAYYARRALARHPDAIAG